MAKQLNVDMRFTADTSKAKQSINELQQAIQKLGYGSMPKNAGIDPALYKKAAENARELAYHLNAAYNTKTGNLDLSKLNASLKQSGTSLNQLTSNFHNAGAAGQQAFTTLAKSIAAADQPTISVNEHLSTMFVTLKNVARFQISSSIMHGLIGGIQTAYNYAQDLNESLNNIRIVTGQSVDQMARFADYANKTARQLSATTLDYTNASLIYYQQGLNDQQVKERTDVTIKMANVARESAETVSQQLTAIWNNFDDGSKSLEYYADVITALGAATASSSSEISAGLNKFAAVADTVGLSYENATAALATITATTRQSADTVGTGLRTLFSRLQGLSLGDTLEDGVNLNKYSQALAKVGVQALDSSGNLRRMDEVLEDLGAHWGDLTKAQQTALAQTVGGVRQYTTLVALMDNWDFMKQNQQIAAGAEGTLQNQADIYAESWEAAQKRVKAATESLYQDLIKDDFFIKMNNGLEHLLVGLDAFIDKFGGLRGIIVALLSFVGTAISGRIGPALEKTVQNIKVMVGGSQKVYQQMQSDFSRTVNNEVGRKRDATYTKANGQVETYQTDIYNSGAQAELKGTEALLIANTRLNAVKDSLSAAEKMRAEIAISGIETQIEENKKLGQEIDNTKAKIIQTMEAYKAQKAEADKNVRGKQYEVERLAQGKIEDKATKSWKNAFQKYNLKVEGEDLDQLNKIRDQSNELASILSKNLIKSLNGTKQSFQELFSTVDSNGNSIDKFRTTLGDIRLGNNLNQSKAQLEIFRNSIEGLINTSPKLKAAFDVAFNASTTEDFHDKLDLIVVEYDNLVDTMSNDQISQALRGLGVSQSAITSIIQARDKAAELEKTLQDIEVQGGPKKFLEELKSTVSGITDAEERAKALDKALDQINGLDPKTREDIKALIEQQIELDQRIKNTNQSASQLSFAHAITGLEALTSVAAAFGNIVTIVNSIQSVFNAWKNPDLSPWEKISTTLMGISMTVPAVIAGFTNLNKVLTFSAQLRLASKLGIDKDTAATLLNAASKEKLGSKEREVAIATAVQTLNEKNNTLNLNENTVATNINKIAWLSHPFIWITAIIGGVAAAIALLSIALRKNTTFVERASKTADELNDGLEKTSQLATELKDKFATYNDIWDKIKNCAAGTDEWRGYMEELNKQTKELIEQYPILQKYKYLFENYHGYQVLTPESADEILKLVKDFERVSALSAAYGEQNFSEAKRDSLNYDYEYSFNSDQAKIFLDPQINDVNSFNSWQRKNFEVNGKDYSDILYSFYINNKNRSGKIKHLDLEEILAYLQGQENNLDFDEQAFKEYLSKQLNDGKSTTSESFYEWASLHVAAREIQEAEKEVVDGVKNNFNEIAAGILNESEQFSTYNDDVQGIIADYASNIIQDSVTQFKKKVSENSSLSYEFEGFGTYGDLIEKYLLTKGQNFQSITNVNGNEIEYSYLDEENKLTNGTINKDTVDIYIASLMALQSSDLNPNNLLDEWTNEVNKIYQYKSDFEYTGEDSSGGYTYKIKELQGKQKEFIDAILFNSFGTLTLGDLTSGDTTDWDYVKEHIKNLPEETREFIASILKISVDQLDEEIERIKEAAEEDATKNKQAIEEYGIKFFEDGNGDIEQLQHEQAQAIVNAYNEISLSGGRQNLAQGIFNQISDIAGKDQELLVQIIEHIHDPSGLTTLLTDKGIDQEAINNLINSLSKATNFISPIEELKSTISSVGEVLSGLDFGKTIKKEDYDKLIQYKDAWKDFEKFFMLQADGNYRFIGNQQDMIDGFTAKIKEEQEQLKELVGINQRISFDTKTGVFSSKPEARIDQEDRDAILELAGYSYGEYLKVLRDNKDLEVKTDAYNQMIEAISKVTEVDSSDLQESYEQLASMMTSISQLNALMPDIEGDGGAAYFKQFTYLAQSAVSEAKTLGEAQAIFDSIKTKDKTNKLTDIKFEDWDQYSTILQNVAGQYESCRDELLRYQDALYNGTDADKAQAENALKVAIALEEIEAAAGDATVKLSDYGQKIMEFLASGGDLSDTAALAKLLNISEDEVNSLLPYIAQLKNLKENIDFTTGAFQQMEERLSSISSTIKNLDFGSIISNDDYKKIKAFVDEMQRLGIVAATGIDVDSLFLAQADGSQKFIGDQKQLHDLLVSNLNYEQEINDKTKQLRNSLKDEKHIFTDLNFNAQKDISGLKSKDLTDVLIGSGFKEEDIAAFFTGKLTDEALFNNIKNTILNFWIANLDEIDQNLQERRISLARNFTELNDIFNEEGNANLKAYSQQWKVLTTEALGSAKTLTEVTSIINQANAGAADFNDGLQLTDNIAKLNATDLKAYTDALLTVADGYESCVNEAMALQVATDETRQQAADTLAFAIAIEEVNSGMYQGTTTANKYAKAVEDIVRSGEFTKENIAEILDNYDLGDIVISDEFIRQLEEMKDIVLKIDPVFARLKDSLKDIADLTHDLDFGSLISEEDYQRLAKYVDGIERLFQLQTNGQYKFIGTAEDVAGLDQEYVNKSRDELTSAQIAQSHLTDIYSGNANDRAQVLQSKKVPFFLTDDILSHVGESGQYTRAILEDTLKTLREGTEEEQQAAQKQWETFVSALDEFATKKWDTETSQLYDMQASLAGSFEELVEFQRNSLIGDGTAFIKEWQDSLREGIQNASTLSELDSTFYNAGQAREAAIGMGLNGEELSIDNTMLSDKYLSLASAYENCADEASAYDQALKNLSQSTDALDSVERKRLEGQVAATEENLLASIYAGELAKQYSLDAKAIESYAERIQDLKPDLKATRMELIEMAKDQLRFDKAVESAEKNLSDWSKSLGKLDASQLSELREAYGNLLDIDGDSLSDKFLNSAHNLMLMQQAIQGSEEAYDELQAAARQELYIKLNLSQEQIANIENNIADIKVPDLEVGAKIEDAGLYESLNAIINACASTAADATSLLSEMGYDAEVITDTNTQPPETVGYDLIPTPTEVTQPFSPSGSIGAPLKATFPGVTYEAKPVPAPDGKTTTATALKIKPGSLAKASGGNIKHTNSSSAGGGGSKKGGGGGGGKSSTKSKKEPVDTGDRYHAVREQLADLKEEYDNLAKAQDRAFGKQRVEIMEKINENLYKTLDTQDRYLQEIRSNLEKDTTALEDMATRVGIKINYDENGVITNYDDLRQAIRDEYNAAVDDYNAGKITDEGFEDIEKRFEESEKAVDLYEESLNLLSKESLEFLNIQNEIEDNSREIIEYKIEYKIELNDDELKYLDFLLQQLDNDAYDVAEALGLLGKEADENLDKIKTYSAGLDELLSRKLSPELMEKFYNGELSVDDLAGIADFTADDIEDIRSYEDAIMSADKALQDARKTVEDKFMSSMQQLEGEVDDVAERFENLTSVLDHYRNIIDIVGKDQLGITDDILKGLTDVQINIGVDQVEESLKKVQAFQNTYDNIVKILSKPDQLTESEQKYWKDRQKDVQKALDEAQEEYLSNFENAVQAIFDGYTQVLERAINKFLENSGLADSIGRLKDFISSVDDENVSNVTKTYELTKLTRDIQKSMDESPNVKNKRSLLELQNKINDAMRDGEKYSQAQLDILRKEYELKMARIALDEMEQAKSTVRMSRDNEGNWSYVYVTDEDQMQAAEDELQTKIYEYNQLVEESYRELIDLSQQMTQDWSDQYKEIMTDTTLSDEERQRQLELLNEKYKEGLDDLNAKQTWMVEAANVLNEEEYKSRAEAINIITDGDAHLQQVFDDTAWAQAAALENMTATLTDFETNAELVIDAGAEAWKEYQANLEEVMEAAGTSVNTFANTVTDRTDEISTEAEEVKESVDQLTESLKNEMEAITEYISKWQQDYVKAIEDIINSNTKLVESCKDLINMLTEANKISYEITNNNNSNGNTGGGANRASTTANYNNSSSGSGGSSGGNYGGGSSGSGGTTGSTNNTNSSAPPNNSLLYYDIWQRMNNSTSQKKKTGGCFAPGTLILMEDYSTKKIENIQIGEFVMAYDEINNIFISKKVTKSYVHHHTPKMVKISLSNNTILTLTPGHPLLSVNGWKSLDIENSLYEHNTITTLLQINDEIININENAFVVQIEYLNIDNNYDSYNIEVEDCHTFLANGFVAHNAKVMGAYDTGGYTGDWNSSEGRLAILHQKEQVFNAEDTEKLLDAAILLRTLDMSISNMAFGLGELMSGSVTDQTETIEQDVHITAEFPNVTNHSEIEEAFNNLIGKAAQFANRKR